MSDWRNGPVMAAVVWASFLAVLTLIGQMLYEVFPLPGGW